MSRYHPFLGHFMYTDYEHFYEPSDDTFLLCDALERDLLPSVLSSRCQSSSDVNSQQKEKVAMFMLEIGSGSGCVSTFACRMMKENDVPHVCWATDINPAACAATMKTGTANNVLIDVIRSDLVLPLMDQLQGRVDCLIFNPPYVPTPEEEVGGDGIEASWAGGLNGRQVTDRLLPLIPRLLKPAGGACYMVLVDENRPNEIISLMQGLGLKAEIVLKRQARNEALSIAKFSREGS